MHQSLFHRTTTRGGVGSEPVESSLLSVAGSTPTGEVA